MRRPRSNRRDYPWSNVNGPSGPLLGAVPIKKMVSGTFHENLYSNWPLHIPKLGGQFRPWPMTVSFPPGSFAPGETPRVHAVLSAFDIKGEAPRISLDVENVADDNFIVKATTWGDTSIHGLWITWFAYV